MDFSLQGHAFGLGTGIFKISERSQNGRRIVELYGLDLGVNERDLSGAELAIEEACPRSDIAAAREEGNAGAGTGATVRKLFVGPEQGMKGGMGSIDTRSGAALKVGALDKCIFRRNIRSWYRD